VKRFGAKPSEINADRLIFFRVTLATSGSFDKLLGDRFFPRIRLAPNMPLLPSFVEGLTNDSSDLGIKGSVGDLEVLVA